MNNTKIVAARCDASVLGPCRRTNDPDPDRSTL